MIGDKTKDYHIEGEITDLEKTRDFLKKHLNINCEVKHYCHEAQYRIYDIFTMSARALKAKLIVELGTGEGYSARAFLQALRETDGHLYSVDLNWDDSSGGKVVQETMKSFQGEAQITFIHDDATEAWKKWDKGNIDILYVDDGHKYHHVYPQLEGWDRFKPKIIFIHDTLRKGGAIGEPYRAMVDYAEKYKRPYINLAFAEGTGVMV